MADHLWFALFSVEQKMDSWCQPQYAFPLLGMMLYNPWRAVIQFVGSLIILALVDWRLLFGAVIIVPIVYVTHRTWISRIRPQFRRIRAQREEVDSLATESFGGMRVVRAFSRQRAETSRIIRGNHLI